MNTFGIRGYLAASGRSNKHSMVCSWPQAKFTQTVGTYVRASARRLQGLIEQWVERTLIHAFYGVLLTSIEIHSNCRDVRSCVHKGITGIT